MEMMHNNEDLDAELKTLIGEEEGKIQNAAADMSLRHLALLGAMGGEAVI
jgi:hypothetical protein